MSEFIELEGETIVRKSDVSEVMRHQDGTCRVLMQSGCEYELDEPYESIRDKLMGKPSKPRVDDRRSEFADQLVAYFRRKGQNVLAAEIAAFYNSMMLSETEGAG